MKYVSGAVGAAILAASNTHFKSVMEAANVLTQIDKEIYPVKELSEKYQEYYQKFVKTLYEKGYIREDEYA
jgi:sugar (pentulose or hexulose) kinase